MKLLASAQVPNRSVLPSEEILHLAGTIMEFLLQIPPIFFFFHILCIFITELGLSILCSSKENWEEIGVVLYSLCCCKRTWTFVDEPGNSWQDWCLFILVKVVVGVLGCFWLSSPSARVSYGDCSQHRKFQLVKRGPHQL